MKKIFLVILLVCLLPTCVFAKQETKENLLETIGTIQNVQVDDDIIILSTTVKENQIDFLIEQSGEKITKSIQYSFEDICFIFSSGYVDKNNSIIGNEPAFYLYSILESLSTAEYDENNYYNPTWIHKKISEMITTYQEESISHNVGKTFGLHLKKNEKNQMIIEYQYFLDGEDTILVNPIVEAGKNDLLKNPETGNYSFFITTLLLVVIGLAAYTYWEPTKKKS